MRRKAFSQIRTFSLEKEKNNLEPKQKFSVCFDRAQDFLTQLQHPTLIQVAHATQKNTKLKFYRKIEMDSNEQSK